MEKDYYYTIRLRDRFYLSNGGFVHNYTPVSNNLYRTKSIIAARQELKECTGWPNVTIVKIEFTETEVE